MSRTADGLLLATDRGIYRIIDGPELRWIPEHPGFVTPEDEASPQFIQKLVSQPEAGLFIHNTAVGGGQRDHFIMTSSDGGKRYRQVGRPDALERSVHGIAVCGPGPVSASGAYLAVQNLDLYIQPVGSTAWQHAATPASVASIEVVGGANGRFVLGIQTLSGGEIWQSSADSLDFEELPSRDASPWIAVTLDAQGRAVAVGQGTVIRADESWPLPAGWSVRGASFVRSMAQLRFALLAEDGGGGQRVFLGAVGDSIAGGFDPPAVVLPVAPVYDGQTAWLVTPTADLLRLRGGAFDFFAFAGRDLWWTAIGDDVREPGRMALGNRITGRVHVGSEGGDWVDIRARLISSTARDIAIVPGTADGFWLGSFGLYEFTGPLSGGSWQLRTNGMQTYLQTGTLDLMEMSTLYHDPADPTLVWCGTTEGNGPYVSFNRGLSWQRRHDGLGFPGTVGGEDGLPNATQIRAFVIDDGVTWMASFRGGIWRLGSGDLWEQRNRGLPDQSGSAVDSCCFELLDAQVDVRDLILAGGSLLAATAWGVYRDDGATGRWQPSSDGLTNGDIVALAAHPTEPDWILAAARGKFELPDWLYLSVDSGRSWRPIRSQLESARSIDVIWSDPARAEVVAILDGRGAWLLELSP